MGSIPGQKLQLHPTGWLVVSKGVGDYVLAMSAKNDASVILYLWPKIVKKIKTIENSGGTVHRNPAPDA